VSGATSTTCPAYRVVRETGRKLYPGANPGIVTYLVEVFDSTSFLRGFINPNSPIFAAFNSDKPAFLEAPYDTNRDVSGGSYNTGGFTGADNYGLSVLTHGNIIMDGYIDALGQIRCSQQVYMNDQLDPLNMSVISGQVHHRYIGASITLTASDYTIGDRVTLVMIFAGSYTVTFNSANFRTQGGQFASGGAGMFTISFVAANIANNSSATPVIRLVETSRTSALT
jgi:hypothetical protein